MNTPALDIVAARKQAGWAATAVNTMKAHPGEAMNLAAGGLGVGAAVAGPVAAHFLAPAAPARDKNQTGSMQPMASN